ncbi:MAG: chloride channel protein [Myxococcota bacterium]
MESSSLTPQWRRGGHVFMVLVAVACGAAGAFGAALFRFLIRFFQGLFFEGAEGVTAVFEEGVLAEPHDPLEIARALPWWLTVAIPAAGGLIVGPLVYFFAREAKGHGVPEVMEAVALRGGVMRKRTAAVKILASAISIGSGGSVGREGPIVQIGSVLGSTIGQWLRVPARQLRTIVGCGAAAGIAATFNAPIAGAIFAVEVIVGDFAVAQFSPIVISAVVATVISRGLLGNHPAFPVPDYELVAPLELVAYIGVGVVAGIVGLAFMKSLYFTEDAFERIPIPEWLKASIGGAAVGSIAILVPNVLGVGYSTITEALEGNLPLVSLGVFLLAKIVATSITVGSGGSGGVFAPSLFLGAMSGGLVGTLVHGAFPESTATSGMYALVTMGAVVAATTHAPIAAILIIFEMTQSITILPPLMAACVVSTLVASFLQHESIYTMKLVRRGVDIRPQEEASVLKSMHVGEIVDREPEVVPASAHFATLIDLVVESDHTEFFVVSDGGRYLGPIYLAELRRLLHEQEHLRSLVVAGDLVVPGRPTVREDDDLDVVMQLFSHHQEVEEIGVIAGDDGRELVGSVHKRDVIAAYNQETLRRDLAGGISSTVAVVGKVHEVQLGGDYVVRDVHAPAAFVGRTLSELDLRARTGVQVLLLKHPDDSHGETIRVPGASDRIQAGDIMIVAGSREGLERLEAL